MTEAEWLTCDDPRPLLQRLGGRPDDRKARLFGCHCCRRVWPLLDDAHRRAVRASERYADGRISGESWRRLGAVLPPGRTAAEEAAWAAWRGYGVVAAWRAAEAAEEAGRAGMKLVAWQAERAWQAALLRELCGQLSRPAGLDADVLRWNDGTVSRIAHGIYEDRAWGRMPILADALLDAGCGGEELLAHLRGPGPHVRGCWALDVVLARE
ncbi:MAG TPA: hypothetical protein VKA46_16660 [Gemmataceae bacterium]|nr:hypothetical protein [Gemmataceae bacterium]